MYFCFLRHYLFRKAQKREVDISAQTINTSTSPTSSFVTYPPWTNPEVEVPLFLFQLTLSPLDSLIDLESLAILNGEMDSIIRQASVLPKSIKFTTTLMSQTLISSEESTSLVLLLRKVAHITTEAESARGPSYVNSFVMRDRLNFAMESSFNNDIKLQELRKRLLISSSEDLEKLRNINFQIKLDTADADFDPPEELLEKISSRGETFSGSIPTASNFLKWTIGIFGFIGIFFSTLIFICRQKKISQVKSIASTKSKESSFANSAKDSINRGIEHSFIRERSRDESFRNQSRNNVHRSGSISRTTKKKPKVDDTVYDMEHAKAAVRKARGKPQPKGRDETEILHPVVQPFMARSKQIFDDALQAIRAADFDIGDPFFLDNRNDEYSIDERRTQSKRWDSFSTVGSPI